MNGVHWLWWHGREFLLFSPLTLAGGWPSMFWGLWDFLPGEMQARGSSSVPSSCSDMKMSLLWYRCTCCLCIIARQGQHHRITEVVRAFCRSSEPLEAHLDIWICSSKTSGGVWPGPPGFSALVLVSHWRWALGLFLPNGYGRWRWRTVWGAHADGCLGQDGSVRPPGWCSVPEEMKAGSPRSTCCAAWAAHHQMAQCSAGLAANILSEQGNVCLSPLSFQPIKYQQQFSPPQPQPSCALSQPSLPTNLFYFSKDEKGVVYNLVSTRILTLFIFMK